MIREGLQESAGSQAMTANAKEAVAFLHRPQVGRWLLKLSGLPVAAGRTAPPGWRTYKLCLYQDLVLDVVRSTEQPQWLLHRLGEPDYEPIPFPSPDPEVQMVKALAVRSLYAVGAEAGQVTIIAASVHRAKVVSVEPDWPAEKADHYMQKARDWWQERMRKLPQELNKLGADPEFSLRRATGEMALASDFLKMNGTVGCDTTRYREDLALHQHPVAELRPAPSEDPDELFLHIYEALNFAMKKITNKEIEWLAGGMPFPGYPIGGHIHFGGVSPTFALRRKLDAYLALPLVLVEDVGCVLRRQRYGFLGDVREKAYGFEYRTLPSWLVHPVVARGVLHLARLVITSHAQLKATPHLQPALVKAYYRGDKETLEPYVRQVRDELRELPGYSLSRVHLESYFSFLLRGEVWLCDLDLKRAWNLR
ncbi:hypothetical protein AAFJ72_12335 [Brevibacillus gelatini]|uniref:putative amidoligase domain-containing protein n=1 Tax=Brevibacillus gelatini TaxID=1655277 RepID=UPI003D81B358